MSGSDHRAAVCHLHTPTPKCFWAPGSPTANNEAQAWWLDLLSHSLEAQNSLSVPSSKRSSLRMTNSPILPSIQEAAEKSTSLAQRLSLSEAVTVASYDVTTPNDEMLQLGSTFSCGTSCATTTVTTPADELGGVMSSNVYSSLEQIMLDETTGVMGSYFLPRNYLPAHHLNKANSAFEGLANGALKHDKESHNSGQIHKEPVITIVEKSLSVKSSTKVKDLSESKSDTSATTISRLASPTETCVPHGVSEKQLNNPLSCKTVPPHKSVRNTLKRVLFSITPGVGTLFSHTNLPTTNRKQASKSAEINDTKMPREESYGLADLTKDIHTTDPLLFNNNITNKLKTRLSLASTKSRSQRYSGSSTASSVKQTSTDYLPGSQYSTPSESITTLSTPRTSHEQTITIASNNEVYNERSRSTSLFRHFTTRHPHLNDANDTASTKSAPKLKRSGSLSAIKGAIRRASSVRQVLRTPTTSASVSAPAPLVVSDPIVRGGTGGIVDRRHPSRNEWLRSAKSQDRKAAFLKHVQDGEKVLAQKPGLKRAATIMVQRTKEARLQTNTLYMSGGPVSLQRSASLSAVQVAGHSRPDRLQRMKSFRVNAGAAVEQRVPMVARLCAAGFVLSASHPELDDNENEDKKNSSVEFKICDHDNASSCTFMCNGDNDSSAPTILVRVSLNKSQLVQLIVSPKITLTDLKMRINAKFHQCGVINAVVDDQQLIYTDSDGCAVLVNSQKLLEAIISMADGPLTFRVTA